MSIPLTCNTQFLLSLRVSPLLLSEKTAETTKVKTTLSSLHQAYRLTSLPWEFKKNPTCYLLASKCYTSLLDQVSPTQRCTKSPHLASKPLHAYCVLSPSNCIDISTQAHDNSEFYCHPGSSSPPVFFILTSGNTTQSHYSQKSSFLPFPTSHINLSARDAIITYQNISEIHLLCSSSLPAL